MSRKIFFSIFLLAVVCRVAAQSPIDSAQFCDPANWNVVWEQPHLKIRQFHNKMHYQKFLMDSQTAAFLGKLHVDIPGLKDSVHLSFLFDTVQCICIVEVDPKGFRVLPAQDRMKHTVSEFLKSTEATVAVNGGFFVVHPTPGRCGGGERLY